MSAVRDHYLNVRESPFPISLLVSKLTRIAYAGPFLRRSDKVGETIDLSKHSPQASDGCKPYYFLRTQVEEQPTRKCHWLFESASQPDLRPSTSELLALPCIADLINLAIDVPHR